MQQFHSECADILNRTVQLPYDVQKTEIVDSLVSFIDAGNDCAQVGEINMAASVVDFCWSTLDCVKAVTIEAPYEVAKETLAYPKEVFVDPFINAGRCLSNMLSKLADIVSHPGEAMHKLYVHQTTSEDSYFVLMQKGHDKAAQIIRTRIDNAEKFMGELYQEYKKAHPRPRDVAKDITKKGLVFYRDAKIWNAGFKFAGYAGSRAVETGKKVTNKIAESKAVQNLKDLPNRIWKESAKNLEAVTADGVKVPLKNTNFMDKAKNAGGRASNALDKMENFFKNMKFGKFLKNKCRKVRGRRYHGKNIFKITEKIKHPELKQGYHFYLDGSHMDHLEVFDKRGNFEFCLNLDGTKNRLKTLQAANDGNRNIRSLLK